MDRFEENGTQESRISPYTFCKAFPFHIIFDRDLVVTQCGNAIYRVLPQVRYIFICLSSYSSVFFFYFGCAIHSAKTLKNVFDIISHMFRVKFFFLKNSLLLALPPHSE